jgi:hypothetical protein
VAVVAGAVAAAAVVFGVDVGASLVRSQGVDVGSR